MAVVINGTTGITSVNGSASAPSVTGTDTDTGIVYGTNTLSLATGGTTAVTVDSSQNVGIGASTLNDKLNLYSSTSVYQRFQNSTTGTGATDGFQIGNDASAAYIWNYEAVSTVFATSNTERMRIDSSGNVGIGTSSPTHLLSLYKNSAADTDLRIANTQDANQVLIGKQGSVAYGQTAAGNGYLYTESDWSMMSNGGAIKFAAGGNVEKARIDTSGNLLVGTSNASATVGAGTKLISSGAIYTVMSASTNAEGTLQVYSTGAGAFRFYVGLGGTVYATSTTITGISDQRVKENIRDLDDGLEKIMALQPRKFDWKEGKGKGIANDRGFIAQEFEQVFPDMIEEWKDPAPEGEEPYKAVNANLIPTLVKAIQEQQAIIEQLRADVAQLKGQA